MNKIAYTPLEAANMIGISERTLHTLRKRKEFPSPVMFGHSIRYTHKDLEDWVNKLPRVTEMAPQPPQLVGTVKNKRQLEEKQLEEAEF